MLKTGSYDSYVITTTHCILPTEQNIDDIRGDPKTIYQLTVVYKAMKNDTEFMSWH